MTARRIVLAAMVLCLCRLGWTDDVDLSKPFKVDGDTVHLFHMDDVATGKMKDDAGGGPAVVKDATEVEGKFGKAMSCDGTKGWADVTDPPLAENMWAMTVECWVNLKDTSKGDIICRNVAYMIRVNKTITAMMWIDGKWGTITGSKEIPVGKWTHVAMTYDQTDKQMKIYVDGTLDVAKVPDGITDGNLVIKGNLLRLGTNDWRPDGGDINGALDEVRVSSVARTYKPIAAEEVKPAETPKQ